MDVYFKYISQKNNMKENVLVVNLFRDSTISKIIKNIENWYIDLIDI